MEPEYNADSVVWNDEDYLILVSTKLFSTGYNVYKRTNKCTSDTTRLIDFHKINNKWGWFTTLAAAHHWLEEHKKL